MTEPATLPLKALLVDSWYDAYLGVVVLVRVFAGTLSKGMKIRMMATGAAYDVSQVGVFSPKKIPVAALGPGEVGYIITGPASARRSRWCSAGFIPLTPPISSI